MGKGSGMGFITTHEQDAPYAARQKQWDPIRLLTGVTYESTAEARQRCQSAIKEYEPVIWNDLTAEYDSLAFIDMLRGNTTYSLDFQAFMEPWARDEHNHYVATRSIYSALYGESITSITARVESRTADFTSIETFIRDELKLLLLLAYDEIVTAYAYHRDLPFYKTVGVEPFQSCIRYISRDEGIHFDNIIRLIKRLYPHRLDEAKGVLWAVVNTDINGEVYDGTFVMDHKLPYPLFPLTNQELVTKCAGRALELLTGERSFG
jgi:hypothetical protein